MLRLYEPVSSIMYKFTCAYREDSNQSAHPHSFSFLPEEMLDPLLPIVCPLNTLIRLSQKLTTVYPQERSTRKSGVRSAIHAASQLPGRGPTDVDDAPAPASKIRL